MKIHPSVRQEGEDKQYISVDGYQMAYLTAGTPDDTPVVMVHGWLYHAGMWRDLMQVLSQNFYCIAVDLLGHGHSDKPADFSYSIDRYSQHILTLMDALGYDRFIYIGHSMGGMTGLNLAARLGRQRVIKLVDVSGVTSGRTSHYVRTVHLPFVWIGWLVPAVYRLQRLGMRFAWYRQILADNTIYYQRGLSDYDSADIQMAVIPGMEVSAKKAGEAIMQMDLTPYLQDIIAPTLILFGEQDNTVPVAEGYRAVTHIPDSRMVVYDRCGHFPTVERRDRFFADVCAFLDIPIPELEPQP